MKRLCHGLFALGMLLLGAGCGDEPPSLTLLLDDATIVAFGDSLTFGTGAARTDSYPALLEQASGMTVINSGVPGELSSEGLARLPAVLLEHQPDLVILCHGGNDLLRRRNQTALAQNLQTMIESIRQSGAELVLIAVPEPKLTLSVPAIYQQLANQYNIPVNQSVMRDILKNNQLKSDPVHPNKAGYAQLAEAVHKLLIEAGALTP